MCVCVSEREFVLHGDDVIVVCTGIGQQPPVQTEDDEEEMSVPCSRVMAAISQ